MIKGGKNFRKNPRARSRTADEREFHQTSSAVLQMKHLPLPPSSRKFTPLSDAFCRHRAFLVRLPPAAVSFPSRGRAEQPPAPPPPGKLRRSPASPPPPPPLAGHAAAARRSSPLPSAGRRSPLPRGRLCGPGRSSGGFHGGRLPPAGTRAGTGAVGPGAGRLCRRPAALAGGGWGGWGPHGSARPPAPSHRAPGRAPAGRAGPGRFGSVRFGPVRCGPVPAVPGGAARGPGASPAPREGTLVPRK